MFPLHPDACVIIQYQNKNLQTFSIIQMQMRSPSLSNSLVGLAYYTFSIERRDYREMNAVNNLFRLYMVLPLNQLSLKSRARLSPMLLVRNKEMMINMKMSLMAQA